MITMLCISDGWVTAIATSILALLTIALVIYAIRAYGDSRRVFRQERFENKFYELLKLHKANVDEMNIAENVYGRKCFVPMFYELKYCYQVVEGCIQGIDQKTKIEKEIDRINIMKFAYRIFFFGLGTNSEKHFVSALSPGESFLFSKTKQILKEVQGNYMEFTIKNSGEKNYNYPLHPITREKGDYSIEFLYFPFDGHINRLGHYYRHLFQTAKYVTSQDFLIYEEKYNYIKTLRAQLSNFEQLLLYYNALAWFDQEWREIFTIYRFIKNLPIPLADFYIRPHDHFEREIRELKAKGITMFEWDKL
jgi:hypothetical protein